MSSKTINYCYYLIFIGLVMVFEGHAGVVAQGPLSSQNGLLGPINARNETLAWSPMSVGADLADQIVDEALEGLSEEEKIQLAATVAVVDSGFDYHRQKNGIAALSFSLEPGTPSSGIPTIDPDGHGTPVCGVVSGNSVGITKNVNLKFYRVTPSNASGMVYGSGIEESILKACEKSDVVIVSWGSVANDLGQDRVEKALWYQAALEKGCLVVRAAGNGGVRKEREVEIPFRSPLLTVGAINRFSDDSTFSTTGLVKAPGEEIYSLLSFAHDYHESTADRKSIVKGSSYAPNLGSVVGPLDGTSFAAPAVAGIAGQIVTLLKTGGMLPRSGIEKIVLVKNILMASALWNQQTGSKSGEVNALAASLIAKGITEHRTIPEQLSEFVAMGKTQAYPICSKSETNCDLKSSTMENKTCVDELRYRSLVCENFSRSGVKNLFDVFQRLQSHELTAALLSKKSKILGPELLQSYQNLWKKIEILYPYEVSDMEAGLSLLYKASQTGVRDFLTEKRVEAIIRTTEFSMYFSVASIRGKNIWNGGKESLHEKFIQTFRSLGLVQQKNLINAMPGIDGLSNSAELGVLYMLHEQKTLLHRDTINILETKLVSLAQSWIKGELRFELANVEFRSLPLEDLFFSKISDSANRLESVLSQPPSPENMFLFRFALESSQLPKKFKIELANRLLLNHSNTKKGFLGNLLNDAVDLILSHSKAGMNFDPVKDFLQNSPFAVVSIRLAIGNNLPMGKIHPLKVDKSFLAEMVEVSLARIKSGMTSAGSWPFQTIRIPVDNFFNLILHFDNSKTNELLIKHRNELASLLSLASKNIVKLQGISSGHREFPIKYLSDNLINSYLENKQAFDKSEFRPYAQSALLPLKNDIVRQPHRYSQSFRQNIRAQFYLPDEDLGSR